MTEGEGADKGSARRQRAVAVLRRAYDRFVRIRGTPRQIALGLALGLFVGMSPFMGFQTAFAVFLAALFGWNKLSSAVGVWITNPLTAPLVYSATYIVGARITGMVGPLAPIAADPERTGLAVMALKAPEILWAMTLGGFVLGLPIAAAGYGFAYAAVNRYQERIRQKLAQRRERRAARKMRSGLKKRGKMRKKAASAQ